MAMTLFGTIVKTEAFHRPDLLGDLLASVARKSDERKLLEKFLLEKSVEGKVRFEELQVTTRAQSVDDLPGGGVKDAVINYCRQQLEKAKTSSGVSLYRDLVLQVIEREGDRVSTKVARAMRVGKVFSPEQLPSNFPVIHNKAEVLLLGKLKSEVGLDGYQDYIRFMNLKNTVGIVSKDLFYGINNALSREQTLAFMRVRYEMKKLQTSVATNEALLKQNLLESILMGAPLRLTHVKCLRFTYPHGTRLKLIDHTQDVGVPTKDGGVHRPVSEQLLFSRLLELKNVLERCGIAVRLRVLLSDQDLYDYFPEGGGGVVPDEDLHDAKESLLRYRAAIAEKIAGVGEIEFLREFMRKNGFLGQFDAMRREHLRRLRLGYSSLTEGMVESRVNYRYESNKRILAVDPGREFARERVYAQLASLLSLGVMERKMLLVEEDKGEENKIIGGKGKDALPVFFIKLRDTL